MKNAAWPVLLHSTPIRPADRLPLKMVRNQAATVVAPKPDGARLANKPSPVGRINSSPRVSTAKKTTSHGQPTGTAACDQARRASRR